MKRSIIAAIFALLIAGQCFGAGTVGKPSNTELTIYNDNFALVKEEREMSLNQGINLVSVEDVASTIETNTVAFKSRTDPAAVVVREQNYQYDLIDPGTILRKSIGKRVKVRRYVDGKVEETEGTLLSAPGITAMPSQPMGGYGGMTYSYNYPGAQSGGIVVQTADGILLNPGGEIQVMEMPNGLVSRPTLMWKLESSKAGTHQTEISYLAKSMSWQADYVAVVDPLDKYVDITGWVTLNNQSGTTYESAKLNLMAGDVHRVQQMGGFGGGYAYDKAEMVSRAEPQFTEKSFFEYHLYTLKDKTTVRDKESKQISLISAARVPAKTVYIFDPRKNWWYSYGFNPGFRPGDSYDVSANKKITVMMEVVNKKENNLGIPLPKGTVRVYKQEADANQHFIGEDSIDHTPKDEKIRLQLGNAFDIVGEHARTNFRRISNHEVEESFQVILRNHKTVPVTVQVVEHLSNDWTITDSNQKYAKRDASTVDFSVPVAKDGESKLTYTVRTRWP